MTIELNEKQAKAVSGALESWLDAFSDDDQQDQAVELVRSVMDAIDRQLYPGGQVPDVH